MTNVYADFSSPVKPIRMLHGTNNGPLMYNGDFSPEFQEIGVPFVRFHETHSPGTKCIEVPFIFRDFDADENDERNYYFADTDAVIAAAVKQGITIMYRLGMGTERPNPKMFLVVPPDFKKWARICVNIIRHYNEGWANGFHYGIRYWEIWNEPDEPDYWLGTRQQFFDLYREASLAIRAHDPSLKVGGPAVAWPRRDDGFPEEFLRFVADNKLPFDFYTWHLYSEVPEYIEGVCQRVEVQLRAVGLWGKVESINSEWHAIELEQRTGPGTEMITGISWDLRKAAKICSAVCGAVAMIMMQRHDVSKAALYDADNKGPLSGMWSPHMEKQKQFYAMKAFGELYRAGTEYESSSDSFDVQVMAAAGEKKGYLLMTNYTQEEKPVTLELSGMPGADMQVLILDETRDLEAVDSDSFGHAERVKRPITLPPMSVAMVEFSFR